MISGGYRVVSCVGRWGNDGVVIGDWVEVPLCDHKGRGKANRAG